MSIEKCMVVILGLIGEPLVERNGVESKARMVRASHMAVWNL